MAATKRIAVICASNQNRSMEAHHLFVEKGIPNVSSFGTGSQIKLPGPTRNQPNVYEFGASYQEIYNDLVAKDAQLYARIHSFAALAFSFAWSDLTFIEITNIDDA